MNITMRKLAMLEEILEAKEEVSKTNSYTSCPTDLELRQHINVLMDKVRLYKFNRV